MGYNASVTGWSTTAYASTGGAGRRGCAFLSKTVGKSPVFRRRGSLEECAGVQTFLQVRKDEFDHILL